MTDTTMTPAAVLDAIGHNMVEATSRRLSEFVVPAPAAPDELLRHRFLCRGGAALLVGPTGVGKSSFALQAGVLWTLGHPFFGIEPARPLTVWLVQAENDAGDMAEMRQGVTQGLVAEGTASEKDVQGACERIRVFSEDTRTGDAFRAFLAEVLDREQADRPDLLIVDPLYAYFGQDVSDQAAVSKWTRNIINPLIHQHNIGLVLVHHTNKPATGTNKAQWQAGDFAYLGAGSAEWCNWARAVLALRNIGNDEVYELRAAKRGRRLRWRDENDSFAYHRYVAHGNAGGIYWREPTDAEVEQATTAAEQGIGRPKGANPLELIDQAVAAAATPMPVSEYRATLQDRFKIGEKKVDRIIAIAVERGRLARRKVKTAETHYQLIGIPGAVDHAATERNEAASPTPQ